METSAELEERGDAAASCDEPGRRRQDPSDELEQRRLAAAVGADQPDGGGGCDVEAHVPKRPELLDLLLAPQVDQALLERLVVMEEESLGDVVDPNDGGHGCDDGRTWLAFPFDRALSRRRSCSSQPPAC